MVLMVFQRSIYSLVYPILWADCRGKLTFFPSQPLNFVYFSHEKSISFSTGRTCREALEFFGFY